MGSFCGDCVHVNVCRYVKKVKEYENRPTEVISGTGPVIRYTVVDCKDFLSNKK